MIKSNRHAIEIISRIELPESHDGGVQFLDMLSSKEGKSIRAMKVVAADKEIKAVCLKLEKNIELRERRRERCSHIDVPES